jgi:hypothetical protein
VSTKWLHKHAWDSIRRAWRAVPPALREGGGQSSFRDPRFVPRVAELRLAPVRIKGIEIGDLLPLGGLPGTWFAPKDVPLQALRASIKRPVMKIWSTFGTCDHEMAPRTHKRFQKRTRDSIRRAPHSSLSGPICEDERLQGYLTQNKMPHRRNGRPMPTGGGSSS